MRQWEKRHPGNGCPLQSILKVENDFGRPLATDALPYHDCLSTPSNQDFVGEEINRL